MKCKYLFPLGMATLLVCQCEESAPETIFPSNSPEVSNKGADGSAKELAVTDKFPFRTGVLRDGGTRSISTRVSDGSERYMYIVSSADQKLDGRMFRDGNWESGNAKPLTHPEAWEELLLLRSKARSYFSPVSLDIVLAEAKKIDESPDLPDGDLENNKLQTLYLEYMIMEYSGKFPKGELMFNVDK